MSTLEDMVEHCDSCGEELEIGQIGLCDNDRNQDNSDADVADDDQPAVKVDSPRG